MQVKEFDKTKYYDYIRELLNKSGIANYSERDVQVIAQIYLFELERQRFDYVLTLIKNDRLVIQIAKLYFEPIVEYNESDVDDILERMTEKTERRFLGNPHSMSDSFDDQDYENYQEEFFQRKRKARR